MRENSGANKKILSNLSSVLYFIKDIKKISKEKISEIQEAVFRTGRNLKMSLGVGGYGIIFNKNDNGKNSKIAVVPKK